MRRMKGSVKAITAVVAICALGLASQVSSASANQARLHCGDHRFAHSIKISGPSNEVHSGWNCDTANDMIDKGKRSDDRKEFSSPGWNCSRAPGWGIPTIYCSKHRLLVEFYLSMGA
jgi:hypothetical protein